MKKITIFLIAFLCVWKLEAQMLYPEVMSCFGGDAKNANVQLTFTAGEPLYQTVSNNAGILTQGFNQVVYVLSVTSVEEVGGYEFKAYPNPSSSIVNIEIATENKSKLDLKIIDIQGKLIFANKNINNLEQIDISSFTSGI